MALTAQQRAAYEAWINSGGQGSPPDLTDHEAVAQQQAQAAQAVALAQRSPFASAFDLTGTNANAPQQQTAGPFQPTYIPPSPSQNGGIGSGTLTNNGDLTIPNNGGTGVIGSTDGQNPFGIDMTDYGHSDGPGNIDYSGLPGVYRRPPVAGPGNIPITGTPATSGVEAGDGSGRLPANPYGTPTTGYLNLVGPSGPPMGPFAPNSPLANPAAPTQPPATPPASPTTTSTQRNLGGEFGQILTNSPYFGAQNLYNQQVNSPGLAQTNTNNFNNAAGALAPAMRSAYNAANPNQVAYTGTLQGLANNLATRQPEAVNPAFVNPAQSAAQGPGAAALASFSQGPTGYSQVNPNTGFGAVSAQQGDVGLGSAVNRLNNSGPSQIQNTLTQQAQQGLALGTQLSPEDIRNAQQSAREAWSARGLVNSPGAIGAEILNTDALGRQRLAERQGLASQVEATNFGQGQQGFTNALGVSNASQGYAGLGLQGQTTNLGAQLAGNQLNYQGQAANQQAGLTSNQQAYNYAGLGAQNSQFNAGQQNALQQYYAGLGQSNNQFNAGAQNTGQLANQASANSVGQFNAGLQGANNAALWSRGTDIANNLNQQAVNPFAAAGQITGLSQSPDYTSPLLAYGQDAFNTTFNAGAASNISQQNNSAATNAALIGGLGKIFSNPDIFKSIFG